MTIKNLVCTEDQCYELFAGARSAVAPTITHASFLNASFNHAVKRTTDWFNGRLWWWEASYAVSARINIKYFDSDPGPDAWNGISSGYVAVDGAAGPSNPTGIPGYQVFKDKIYLLVPTTRATDSASVTHSIRYLTATDTSAVTLSSVWTSSSYTKSNTTMQDAFHILDTIVWRNNIYIAVPTGILYLDPATGDITAIDEVSDWDDTVAKAFSLFGNGTTTYLYYLEANGKVKQVSGVVTERHDLTTENGNIASGVYTGGGLTDLSIGWGPHLCQVGDYLYAFLNDTTGVVCYRSDDGTTWADWTSNVPVTWQTANAHIKGIKDPVTGDTRILFIADPTGRSNTGATEEYTLETNGTFSWIGAYPDAGAIMTYDFFDENAVDTEIATSPVVDNANGKVTFTYTLYREVSATGIVTIIPEYSEDGGTTWATATRKGSEGDGLTGLNASDAGVSYDFVWDWVTDLGAGLHTSVVFRIRAENS